MALTLYLLNAAETFDLSPASFGANMVKKKMSATRGGSASSQGFTDYTPFIANPNDCQWGAPNGYTSTDPGLVWISPPLAGYAAASFAITYNFRASESSAMANASVGIDETFLIDSSGNQLGTLDVTLIGSSELGTSEAARSFVGQNSLVDIPHGSRIVTMPSWIQAGGTLTGGFTLTAFWNGPTSGASGDSFITITMISGPDLTLATKSLLARGSRYRRNPLIVRSGIVVPRAPLWLPNRSQAALV